MRPETEAETGGWQSRGSPFLLGTLLDSIKLVHSKVGRGTDLWTAVNATRARLTTGHDGAQTYLRHALDRYFEYHEGREHELGSLGFISSYPMYVHRPTSKVAAWGALYESASGVREMRRLRFGAAHRDLTAWAHVAAKAALAAQGNFAVSRVVITELGLLDGIERHVLDVSAADAELLYQERGRPVVLQVVEGIKPRTGHGCASCKITAVCPEPIKMTGALQQSTVGPWLRSVSASDLDLYERCPSRWYMDREIHLPKDDEFSEALQRGTALHQVLARAHVSGRHCVESDFPEPGTDECAAFVGDNLDEAAYVLAYPLLRAHLRHCPLGDELVEFLTVERTLYGFDDQADVVIATKADMLWKVADTLVLREVKSTQDRIDPDPDRIFDRYLQVAWNLVALESGLARRFGCQYGEVQLEVLSASGSFVYKFRTDDDVLMRMARGRIQHLAEEWLYDETWAPKPGVQCTTCSVGRWCSARDQGMRMIADQASEVSEEDVPPF